MQDQWRLRRHSGQASFQIDRHTFESQRKASARLQAAYSSCSTAAGQGLLLLPVAVQSVWEFAEGHSWSQHAELPGMRRHAAPAIDPGTACCGKDFGDLLDASAFDSSAAACTGTESHAGALHVGRRWLLPPARTHWL